ncbi:MAG TPA: hypothetical protein DD458_10680 [Prolixibacteraceae bacterium]|nr:MAG: hypothetical protein A2W89_04745 [Bacteroidetes bacterium GWE2_42_39]HBL75682.1 hypothetical protein [Prolixibacteraceae bacterium]
MRTKRNINGLITGLLLLTPVFVNAQFSEAREFEKRFKIQAGTRIEITNKYGYVELNTWNKDSVYIKVEIKVEEKKLDKLEKTLDGIDFDFTNSPHYLIARTLVGETRNQLENELIKFKESLLQTTGNVTIDYKVWLPDNHELRVENKFGDILMGDYSGITDISLSNGKLRAKTFKNKLNLNLNFADATLGNVANGRIYCNYSDIYIKESGQLRFDSKSSTIEILQTNRLDADSRRDKFRVRLIDQIEVDGNFSSFRLGSLTETAKLRTSYGDVEMENVDPKFENIYIEARSTNLNLYFDTESKFNFEITESKTGLDLGREVKILDTVELDPKEKKNRHKCSFGEKPSGVDKLIINSVAGEINVLSY